MTCQQSATRCDYTSVCGNKRLYRWIKIGGARLIEKSEMGRISRVTSRGREQEMQQRVWKGNETGSEKRERKKKKKGNI